MEILLLTFANNREMPLKSLADEYAALNKTLSPRALRQHFLSWAVSHATLDDIAYYLTLFRDRLSLFLYSGHAGRDMLVTEGVESRAGGIAHLLGQCPKFIAPSSPDAVEGWGLISPLRLAQLGQTCR